MAKKIGKISIEEYKYILYAGIFAIVLFVFVVPYFLLNVNNPNPFVIFLIFNIGVFVFLQIFLKSLALEKSIKLKSSFGILALYMALDIWTPPLAVDMQGNLLSGIPLVGGASDYIFGYIAHLFNISGFWVYLFTYIIVPIILLITSAVLIKNFLEQL